MKSSSGKVFIQAPHHPIQGVVTLPLSKSLSTRALVLSHLSRGKITSKHLSTAQDVKDLSMILTPLSGTPSEAVILHAGEGGAVMRFALAIASISPGRWVLTGSKRLQERPIGILAQALLALGAQLHWLGKPGYLPVEVIGQTLHGKQIYMDADESSQHMSALCMIAPLIKGGLELVLNRSIVSGPYLDMTLSLLRSAGIPIKIDGSAIRVEESPFQALHLEIESDWSAAAFMYAACALSPGGNIFLPGLKTFSLQGDRRCADFFKSLGVLTLEEDRGIRIIQTAQVANIEADLCDYPDLLPALAVTAAGLGIHAKFTGLSHLRIKESNRLDTVTRNLQCCGYECVQHADALEVSGASHPQASAGISAYSDHRIAMSFAMLSIPMGSIEIHGHESVSKSWPGFWKCLQELGWKINPE